MPSASQLGPSTSEDLLQLLGDEGDRRARECAWSRFVKLYGPAIQV